MRAVARAGSPPHRLGGRARMPLPASLSPDPEVRKAALSRTQDTQPDPCGSVRGRETRFPRPRLARRRPPRQARLPVAILAGAQVPVELLGPEGSEAPTWVPPRAPDGSGSASHRAAAPGRASCKARPVRAWRVEAGSRQASPFESPGAPGSPARRACLGRPRAERRWGPLREEGHSPAAPSPGPRGRSGALRGGAFEPVPAAVGRGGAQPQRARPTTLLRAVTGAAKEANVRFCPHYAVVWTISRIS